MIISGGRPVGGDTPSDRTDLFTCGPCYFGKNNDRGNRFGGGWHCRPQSCYQIEILTVLLTFCGIVFQGPRKFSASMLQNSAPCSMASSRAMWVLPPLHGLWIRYCT